MRAVHLDHLKIATLLLFGVTNATPLSAYDTPPSEGSFYGDIVTELTRFSSYFFHKQECMIRASFVAIALHASSITRVYADEAYTIYEADEFGNRSILSEPKAVIELDELTGEGKVYEPDIFGEANTAKGPKYIIEPDPFNHKFSRFGEFPPLFPRRHSFECDDWKPHRDWRDGGRINGPYYNHKHQHDDYNENHLRHHDRD